MVRIEHSRALLAVALALALTLAVVAVAPPRAATSGPAATTLRASSSALTLGADGISPLTLSLVWTRTADGCFHAYTLKYATSAGGAWSVLETLLNADTVTQYVTGLVPGETTWWQVDDTDCSLAAASSNVVAVTQPHVAVLAAANVGGSSVDLSWTNDAHYGGAVGFVNYRVMKSTAGGPYEMAAVISASTTRSVHLSGLAPSTDYAFVVNTTDRCLGCAAYTPSTTESNAVSVTTAVGIQAAVSQDLPVADVGMEVTFTCTASNGVAPYAYAWSFGDGVAGYGPTVAHAYASAGTKTVTCTATDATGGLAHGTLAQTVSPALHVTALSGVEAVVVGGTVSFTANATGGTGTHTFLWSFGDGTTATGPSVTHAYGSAGTFTANVTVTDDVGGNATATARAVEVQGAGLESFFTSARGWSVIILLAAGAGAAAVFFLRRRGRRPVDAPAELPVSRPSAGQESSRPPGRRHG